jgi:3-phosphoshikimate 1-carboxyvinyltransferase
MLTALQQLGADYSGSLRGGEVEITGTGGRLASGDHHLQVGNSGTTIRFLSSVATLGDGTIRLEGVARMQQRPIQPLVDALQTLGVKISCGPSGCPPVVIRACGLPGGRTSLDGSFSSQFLSGILMAAPYAEEGVQVETTGSLVSEPYLTMTTEVMKSFGVSVAGGPEPGYLVAGGQQYSPTEFSIEPDATAASYLLAIPAITGGRVTVTGLGSGSIQGDLRFTDCLGEMGCRVTVELDRITVEGRAERGIDVDMSDMSDTVQTLAVVAMFVEGETVIRNVAHNRHKETDRIGNLAAELRKLGAVVQEREDGLTISRGSQRPATLETYDDHRMAMSLSLAGLKIDGVIISDPDCTRKTYPDYFRDLEAVVETSQHSPGGDAR